MRLAVTGFVSEQAGSVASANALLLRGLLDRGCDVTFFSKASFVDPRPIVGDHPAFRFVDVDNVCADRIRARLAGIPIIGKLASIADAFTYNRLLVRMMNAAHNERPFDLALWLGDYAAGPVRGIPTVTYAQGPPGTDARSLIARTQEIAHVAGSKSAWKWRTMAAFRLSRWGLPPFAPSDCIIVGSQQSVATMERIYGIPSAKLRVLPYPIDLNLFQLPPRSVPSPTLRCLWVGRIIPRKRLDLLLDAAARAIRSGTDLTLTIIGGIGFVPGYDRLIQEFAFPERLTWIPSVPREEIPAAMDRHDILIQPSEEENFGSSVAEAQACGMPVIVGRTNGNADFLCVRDIQLSDYRTETLAEALQEFSRRKVQGAWGDPRDSRRCAEEHFALEPVMTRLMEILTTVSAQEVTPQRP